MNLLFLRRESNAEIQLQHPGDGLPLGRKPYSLETVRR